MILDPDLNARLGEALRKAWGRVPLSWHLSTEDYTKALRGQPAIDVETGKLATRVRPILGLPVELATGVTSTLLVKERTSEERSEIEI